MSELFAKITGQFTGALFVSAFFPVLLFITALTLVVLPVTPYGDQFTAAVQDPKYWENHPFVALILTVVILVLSVVLYNINTQIVRLYEGYPWKDAWVAKPMLWVRVRHFSQAELVRQRIAALRREVKLFGTGAALDGAKDSQGRLAVLINSDYPESADLVLPTRLGNVIRSFERYPKRQYAINAIALWPRLQAVVDIKLAQSLDSVKTSFDFMLHSAFLSGILALLTSAFGLYWKTRALHDLWQSWLAWTLAFGSVSYLFYLASIRRAVEWGQQVKAVFDLHRLDLIEKLGYESKPTDARDERRIWENLNYKFAFPDERVYPDLPYKQPPSYLIIDPPATIVTSKRTVTPVAGGDIEIKIEVSNLDPTAWGADRVIIHEDVPPKLCVPDSVRVNNEPASLLSIAPLEIDLGALPFGKSRIITYRIKGGAAS